MGLDRNFIERDDFASARKGHDPAEVAEHLAAVAEAVEELKRSSVSQRPPPASATAADHVRSIVQAAESSAAEIEAGARQEAERLRAAADAESIEQVERVRQAAAAMLERAEAIEREMGELVHSLAEGLRSGAAALGAEVARLRTTFGEARGTDVVSAATPPPADTGPDVPPPDVESDPDSPEADEPVPEERESRESALGEPAPEEPAPDAGPPDGLAGQPPTPTPQDPAPAVSNGHERAGEPGGAAGTGSEGARLIALNMALNGTPREQTASYLRENFELDEPERILDEVYARVGG